MPHLRAIFRCGVGTDNIPFSRCEQRGIHVRLPSRQTQQVIFEETAGYAVHLVLKALFDGQGDVDDWSKTDRPALEKRRVLVLGQGNIGRLVSAKLGQLVRVTSWDPMLNDISELAELIGQADVVTLHMPLNEATTAWFDASKLGLMKDGAALVNTARGAIVHEADLYREVSSGRLRAFFDVFWQEPYEGPLRKLRPEQFFMSPHIASHSLDFINGLADDLNELISDIATGRI